MAQHGSHKYEVKRNRIRNDLDNHGIPDKRADEMAKQILEDDHGTKNRTLRNPKETRYLRRSTRKEGANGPEGRRS
jgi:NAD+--asparagine ADP-ribosyltransferase